MTPPTEMVWAMVWATVPASVRATVPVPGRVPATATVLGGRLIPPLPTTSQPTRRRPW